MMQIELSSRLNGVAESATLKMSAATKELTAKGIQVVNLTAGEPDFPVFPEVKKAAIAAIESNFSRYTLVPGILELREAICKKFEQENKLSYKPDQVVVSTGAKQSLFNLLLALISPGAGDEVIIPAPFWVSYPEMVKIAGGVPVIIQTDSVSEFKMTPEKLKAALTSKTKALLLNSPSNPTGVVYTEQEFKAIAKALEGTNVVVISDEIYEKIIFKGSKFTSFASLSSDAFERTVTINGFSKAFSMTGWRLGYAAGPKKLISAMSMLQGQSTSNPNSIVQKAALQALQMPGTVFLPMVEAFERRRNKMAEIFSSANFSFIMPQGAFYFFLNIEPYIGKQYNHDEVLGDSEDLAFYLLNIGHVGSVAGKGFGADSYLRLSFAVSDSDVEEGARRIIKALTALK